MSTDDFTLGDLFDIAILNELLRKDLLIASRDFITNFEKSQKFDYSRPIAYPSFLDHIKENASLQLKLKQFALNLELFIVKLYKIGEVEKSSIKGTRLKSLRQAFAHRTSYDILAGKERAVFVAGLMFDLQAIDIAVMTDGGKEAEHIHYSYSAYVDLLLSDIVENFKEKKDNIKQLRELNAELAAKLFPDLKE